MIVKAPNVLCIYDEEHIVNTLNFISNIYTLAANEKIYL